MCPDLKKELSVILPAFEEADNLRWLLPELKLQLEALQISYEILVVDAEFPRDDTPHLCEVNSVRYLPRSEGSLYSHALKSGIQHSIGEWVLCMDADGSHPPNFIGSLWKVRHGADLVIASRYVKGGSTENPAILILLSYAVNVVFRSVLGIKCHDLSNSFRLYQGDALRKLDLQCENFDIVEEILLKLSLTKKVFLIREMPFTFAARKAGKTKRDLKAFTRSYLSTLWRLWKLKRASR